MENSTLDLILWVLCGPLILFFGGWLLPSLVDEIVEVLSNIERLKSTFAKIRNLRGKILHIAYHAPTTIWLLLCWCVWMFTLGALSLHFSKRERLPEWAVIPLGVVCLASATAAAIVERRAAEKRVAEKRKTNRQPRALPRQPSVLTRQEKTKTGEVIEKTRAFGEDMGPFGSWLSSRIFAILISAVSIIGPKKRHWWRRG